MDLITSSLYNYTYNLLDKKNNLYFIYFNVNHKCKYKHFIVKKMIFGYLKVKI